MSRAATAPSWLVLLSVPGILAAVALTLVAPTQAPARQTVSVAAFGPTLATPTPRAPVLGAMAPARAARFAHGLTRFSDADLAAQSDALRRSLDAVRPGPLAADLTDALILTQAEVARRAP